MGHKIGQLKMKKEERAKQFAPFNALTGLYDAIALKERMKVEQIELSDDDRDELDRVIRKVKNGDMISIVYLDNDDFIKKNGMISRIDFDGGYIKVVDTKIYFNSIYKIEFA